MTIVEPKEASMGKPANDEFDAKAFLAKVGAGKTILEFHKNQNVFEQGDIADTVFYIQKGKVKLTVLSEQGKEAVVAILEPGQFFGEGCMNGHKLRISTTNSHRPNSHLLSDFDSHAHGYGDTSRTASPPQLMSALGPRLCENVHARRLRRIVFSLFSFYGACQSSSFLIQRNRNKRSTRKFDVGVFTQPGSLSEQF
jgi:hypothetical protein